MKWIALIAGGTFGTVARYVVSGLVTRTFGTTFPSGTMVVNLSGCFLLGFLAIVVEGKFLLNPHTKLLLVVGFCGAYTTFSTFILETAHLMRDGENMKAFANMALSLALGFVALKLGVLTGSRLT